MAAERFSMLLVGSFGILAVLLAAVGLYGVISYSVAQRTREIGIRVALGAQRGDVFSMIIRHGLWLSGLGILIGIVAALGTARILTSFLYGVSASDPLTFLSVSAFLAVIAVGASFFPPTAPPPSTLLKLSTRNEAPSQNWLTRDTRSRH